MSDATDRPVRRRFAPGVTAEDLKKYMAPFVATLGYKFNTETDFVDEVLASELEILEKTGDVFCPCRIRTGDPREDAKIVCPCIPFYLEQFAAMQKCWCGLFIRTDVQDGADLLGVVEELEPDASVDVPVCRVEDLPDGHVRHVKIGKRDIALARVGEEYYALSNLCRHAFGPLSDGILDGYYVMCPWHGWRYDLRDGSTDHPDADVKTYEAHAVGDTVLVRVGPQ